MEISEHKPPTEAMYTLLISSWVIQMASDAMIFAIIINIAALIIAVICIIKGKPGTGIFGIILSVVSCPFAITGILSAFQ